MRMSFKAEVDFPRQEVFDWHTRAGAIERLTPPWVPVKVVAEASNLRDGEAILSMAGWRWVAKHQADEYHPPGSFADELSSSPFGLLYWHHRHLVNDLGDGRSEVEDQLDTNVPAFAVRQMFAYRQRQLAADLAAHAWAARLRPAPLTVAMTGSSGSIGRTLRAFLTTGGHRVVRLVRGEAASEDQRHWDVDHPDAHLLDGIDAVVHLAGKAIYGRFTKEHERAVYDSRVGPTRELARVAAQASSRGRGPDTFVSSSAVGYYGYDRGDEVVTEDSGRGDGILADLAEQWEQATEPARDAGLRVVNIRTGIVQSPKGGMLQVLYPLFLSGLGGRLGSGRQWVPWIGMDDIVDIYLRALVDPSVSGPVNAVAPGAVTNRDYTATLGRVLKRPAVMAVPALAARVALGPDGAREFALAGQRAEPAVLARVGHQFRHGDLETALRHLLGRWPHGESTGSYDESPLARQAVAVAE